MLILIILLCSPCVIFLWLLWRLYLYFWNKSLNMISLDMKVKTAIFVLIGVMWLWICKFMSQSIRNIFSFYLISLNTFLLHTFFIFFIYSPNYMHIRPLQCFNSYLRLCSFLSFFLDCSSYWLISIALCSSSLILSLLTVFHC